MASSPLEDRRTSDIAELSTSLPRVNAVSFAIVFGVVAGAGLWIATVFLVIKGGPNPGHTLRALGYAFPGYSVSFGGAFVGLFWAFVLGFATSLLPAWVYYRGVLLQIGSSAGRTTHPGRIHTPYFAMTFGLLCGFALLLSTLFLIVKHRPGEPLGPHLGLLSQYLPGYAITVVGSLVGFAYFLVIGTVVFSGIAWIYNHLVGLEPNAGTHVSLPQQVFATDD